jgi:hypothetical protein
MKTPALVLATVLSLGALARPAWAEVGDPQVRTDDPWYPGELACSTFERLAATQAEVYERVVGVRPTTDEQKALASWLWRNTHYFHAEEGAEDLWGQGFTAGSDLRNREYWTGLFADGFSLCGTTHGQWVAEMEALLGHGRGRVVGVDGHNSFEVFLTGGPYGNGKWVLLDHDVSTVIFNREGTALLSIPEVAADWKRLTDRSFAPVKQHGWLVCGLHPDDGAVYRRYETAEYLAGYSGPPPMVHLRRGETFRRYPRPGLDDGKTFVYWGLDLGTDDIPGPQRPQTWVNQPERMHGSQDGTGSHEGQARYGNAVYVYRPDFTGRDYKEGVVEEDDRHVVFEFTTPYIIAATPRQRKPWGIYEPGCRNGLVLRGKAEGAVAVSSDRGRTWQDCGTFADGMDLTDRVKGHRQYLLRFGSGAAALATAGLSMTTVCQANPSVMPRLKDGGSTVRFDASGRAVVSAGPNLEQARTHLAAGKFGTPAVTLALASPRGEPVLAVYAAAHVQSGSPPNPEVKYQMDVSADDGRTWQAAVKDWSIPRRGDEPKDFWSQSLCWGALPLDKEGPTAVRVRFRNDGGKSYLRCEAHLVYRASDADGTKVTFAWTDDGGSHEAAQTFGGASQEGKQARAWSVPTGRHVQTRWVEFEPVQVR